ncbi:MAG: DUF4382 domain-containing protein [Nitrospirota bacterium]
MKNRITVLLSFLISCLIAVSILSCSSGGSSGNSEGQGTGSVAVILTDLPSDDFLEINITIRAIELLSDGGHITIFSEDDPADYLAVDLLDLRNEISLVMIAENVPAISYNKIRLTVDSVELVKLIDHDLYSHDINLPGNNKIDLNPRGNFSVQPGQMLTLQLDIDANYAIHVVTTRNSTEYNLRPEVFIDIVDAVDIDKIMRFTGIVHNIDEEKFELCNTGILAEHIDPVRHMCIYVYVTEATSFFSAVDGGPVEEVHEGDMVTAIGFYMAVLPENSNENNEIKIGLDAIVVEIGTFLKLKGTIISAFNVNDGQFDFEIAPGQGYVEGYQITVEVQDRTKIYTWDGENIELSGSGAIESGRNAEVDGIMLNTNSLNSAFILIDIPQIPPI